MKINRHLLFFIKDRIGSIVRHKISRQQKTKLTIFDSDSAILNAHSIFVVASLHSILIHFCRIHIICHIVNCCSSSFKAVKYDCIFGVQQNFDKYNSLTNLRLSKSC